MVRADVLLAADGIRSQLRRSMHPSVDPNPVDSGLTIFRGVTAAKPFLDGKTMVLCGNSQLKLVAYPIKESW